MDDPLPPGNADEEGVPPTRDVEALVGGPLRQSGVADLIKTAKKHAKQGDKWALHLHFRQAANSYTEALNILYDLAANGSLPQDEEMKKYKLSLHIKITRALDSGLMRHPDWAKKMRNDLSSP